MRTRPNSILQHLPYLLKEPSTILEFASVLVTHWQKCPINPSLQGQYGRILSLSVNVDDRTAQVLYQLEEDAATCVKCCHGVMLDGQMLRAYIGVTQYCPVFLKTGVHHACSWLLGLEW